MKVIIDIPDKWEEMQKDDLFRAIIDGQKIQKHGRLIDADKFMLCLNDWSLTESPDENTPDRVQEYTAKDMQRMVYRTIIDCMSAVQDAETVVEEDMT